MSSIVSFTVGIVEYVRDRKTEGWIFAGIAFLFLLVACDAAWQDEHRNASILIAEKSLAIQGDNFWRDQSYQKDGAIRSRDQLLAQNYTALIGQQGVSSQTQSSLADISRKLLDINKPVAHKLTVLVWKEFDPKTENQEVQYLLLTNTPVTPFRMQITCDSRIDELNGGVVGGPSMGPGDTRVAPNSMIMEVDTPAWTPVTPFRVTLKYKATKSGACSFVER